MTRTTRTDTFVEAVGPAVVKAARRAGLDPIAILAQSALETAWGSSSLTTASKNLFNIKAGTGWHGATIRVRTREESRSGSSYYVYADFRSYPTYDDSVADYIGLLERRYPQAIDAGTDRAKFFAGLVAGGYATDHQYAAKLTSIADDIEQTYGATLRSISGDDAAIGFGGLIVCSLVGAGVYYAVRMLR